MAITRMSSARASAQDTASPMLTIADVAFQLSVSERTVRRWIDAKQLKAHRLNRAIRIAKADLQYFLDRSR